jgi:hypothetical protein
VPFATYATDYMLSQLTANHGGYLSAHSAYSSTGANELIGGSPAYARVVPTWGTAAAGSIASSSISAAFNVPAGSTVAFIGVWDASTSGNFQGMGPNGGAAQYAFTCPTASPGVFTAIGSSYANGTQVVLFPSLPSGSSIPTGFTPGTIYYVVSASGATFELSATSGGSGINATAAGSGLVQAITTESFGAQGTFTVTTETLTII